MSPFHLPGEIIEQLCNASMYVTVVLFLFREAGYSNCFLCRKMLFPIRDMSKALLKNNGTLSVFGNS